MSLFIASLNSGSNGNCYYIGNSTEAVLVDAGISCRETEKRMNRLGLPMEKIKAVFISHEHSDHISGIETLSKKYQLPVYITPGTHQQSNLRIHPSLTHSFQPHQPVTVGTLSITAFPKFHDAADPHSFIIACNAVKVGVFTDIGNTCIQVIHYFQQCHAAILESNYDTEMLAKGSYPYHLKKRISGGNGHLSNAEALQLFTMHKPGFMSHLLLGHLSKNNNDPQLVEQLFKPATANTHIIIASRYHETQVYHIEATGLPVEKRRKALLQKPVQLSIF